MEHDIKFYCILSVLAVLSIASLLTLNLILMISSLAVSLFLIIFYKLDYVFEAIIFKKSNLIQMLDGFELSGERTTAIRNIDGKFSATAVAFLETSSMNSIEREKIENVIANSHSPFRFVMQVEKVDIEKLIDNLKTRRSMKEIELSRVSNEPDKDKTLKINSLKRQIEHIQKEIDTISSSGSPLRVSQYIMASAVSDNKFAAQERAKSHIRELSSEFGALIGSKSEILTGNDLLQILKFDSYAI